jgi:hypothetical protein
MKLYKAGLSERLAACEYSREENVRTSGSAAALEGFHSVHTMAEDVAPRLDGNYSATCGHVNGATFGSCSGTGRPFDNGALMCLDEGMSAAEPGQFGEGGSQELEVALVEWSRHLDFESYLDHWARSAVTLASEAWVPQLEQQVLTMMVE